MFDRKGRDLLPECFKFVIVKDGYFDGLAEDAPEWAQKQYEDWKKSREARHKIQLNGD